MAKLDSIPLVSRPWNFIMRGVQFIKEVWAELNKVVWPSKAETKAYTLVVIVAVTIVATYIGILDVVFAWLVDTLKLYR